MLSGLIDGWREELKVNTHTPNLVRCWLAGMHESKEGKATNLTLSGKVFYPDEGQMCQNVDS